MVHSVHKLKTVRIVRSLHLSPVSGHSLTDADWEILERFIKLNNFYRKIVKSEIADMVENVLVETGIDIQDCRGQEYDNGANMSGKAAYSPCSSHTLNLVGVHSAQTNIPVSNFFGNIDGLYTFVSGSPERWAIFKNTTGCSLHQLSDSHWTAWIDAVRPVAKHLPSVNEALESILSTCSRTGKAKNVNVNLRPLYF